MAKHATVRPAELAILGSGKPQVEGSEVEATLLSKRQQRDEGGEEARIMTRVSGQDPSDCGKTGGGTRYMA